MKPELPKDPREELELRLTALLLGELSETEAAAVREAIAKEPELARLHDDLKQTIRLIRVAATSPEGPASADAPQLKLSEARRQELQTAFAIPPLKPSDRKPKPAFRTRLIEVLAVLAIVALLASVSIPNFVKSRTTSQSNAVINNLRQLDGAKQQWALEQAKSPDDVPTMQDLAPYLKGVAPVMGETYALGKVRDSVSAEAKSGRGQRHFRLPESGQSLAESANLQSDYSVSGELAFAPKDEVQPLTLGGANDYAGALTMSAGSSPTHGVSPTFEPLKRGTPPPHGPADANSLNVVGNVSKSFDAKSAAPIAGRDVQVYLPSAAEVAGEPGWIRVLEQTGIARQPGLSTKSSGDGDGLVPLQLQLPAPTLKGTPEDLPRSSYGVTTADGQKVAGVQEWMEKTPQLGVPLQGGGRGGGGAGGVSHGYGEFAAKGVTLGADFSDADQLVARTTQPEGARSYGSLNLGAAPATPASAPLPSASTAPRYYRAKPGAEGIASPSSVAEGKKETIDDSTWSLGNLRGELKDKQRGEFAIRQAYVAPPPPAATPGTLTINEGAVSDDFTTRTDGDTAKVPVLGDLPVLGRAFENKPAAPTTSDSGRLSYNEQAQYRRLNQSGTELAAVESPQEHFYGVNAVGQERVAKSFDAKGGAKLGNGLAPQESDKRVNAGTEYYFYDGVRAGSVKAPATSVETFGEIVLPKPAEEVAKLAAVTRGTSSAVPERSLRETKTASAAQAGDATALVQDGRELLEAGKVAEAEGRLKDALKADSKNRAAGNYLALADEQRYREQGEKIRTAQREMEGLRAINQISDVDAAGVATTPLLEAETVRRILSTQMEKKVQLIGREEMLRKLKASSPEELQEVLPRIYPGSALAGSINDLKTARERLSKLKKDHSAEDPEVLRTKALVDDLKQKADKGTAAFMTALEIQVASARAEVAKLDLTLESVKKTDVEKAEESRAYFDKKRELAKLEKELAAQLQEDRPIRRPATNAPIPQPEIQTGDNAFSTFSLNVSDVSFKLAAASLEKGQMPDPASVRSEEFINAFDYRDPEPAPGAPIAFAWERVRYPFAHNRDLLRFSLKTAAAGRQAGRPLNIVLLLDNSGSMERADRVQIIREALRVLASQLQPQDKLSVITFARTPRLFADGVSGDKAGEVAEQVSGLTPHGGTNLEDAMNLAYRTAARHYLANGINRVVLLTDGAANLGNVEPDALKHAVEAQRKQGIALDCFGIGWEGFNDDLLEVLSRNGDGRYGFINSPGEAATEFAGQLAGALKVAASDVKVQVEFNPKRVTSYRQIGYAKHQLKKEQFRDNTVDAAEIAAQEAGNALYTVEANPAGEGPLCTVRVRYKIPGTADYREQSWDVPFTGNAVSLEQASPAMRLAASASAFAEWLVASPFAGEVTPDRLLGYLSGMPEVYGADQRPKKLEWMIRQAKSVVGK